MKQVFVIAAAFALLVLVPRPEAQPTLLPTNHPKLPLDISQLWLAPERPRAAAPSSSLASVAAAIKLQADDNYSRSLAILSQPSVQKGPLGSYAAYYAAEALLKLGRTRDAKRAFQALEAQHPLGYLEPAAAIGEAESDEAQADYAEAIAIYERLLNAKLGPSDDLTMRIGRAAGSGGDTTKAGDAFARVYYEFALSDFAPAAGVALQHLSYLPPITSGSERYTRELSRAERLFSAKQYGPAKAAFEGLEPSATGDDRELVHLRLAECDYFQKRARNARDEVRPYLDHASRQAEALYFYAVASLDLGDRKEYLDTVRRIIDAFPTDSWAEEALDNLASYDLTQDDDAQADVLFRQIYENDPKGSHAERAAWKIGWRAYREGRYDETVQYFEQAAHDFPRSDYRPPWLYWSGRAHEQLGEPAIADDRYKLVTADYLNSYYGRLAVQRMNGWTPAPRVLLSATTDAGHVDSVVAPVLAPPPQNAQIIRDLLSVDLFDQASNELFFAVREWGDSSEIEATIAWVQRQQGRSETGTRQFDLFRGSMTTMKRAYPQFLAAGGEEIPRDVLAVIFPMAYWDLIRKYSAEYDLDPYLMAALVCQESTFVPDIKSYASAVGLTQLMTPTARQSAKRLKLPYSEKLLTSPEANIHIGITYFADIVREFGNAYLALAAYNAGPSPVKRWVSERPGLDREEFIDDIPYPQTQNYVKRILGTAEDYRRLYGPGARRGGEPDLDAKLTSAAKAPAVPAAKPAPAKKSPARAAAKTSPPKPAVVSPKPD